ncbi:MAG: carboxypeptidase regulatory-like domain-containing protein [Acidobacteriaceae bacterium]
MFISKKTLRILVLPCSLLLSTVTALGATITGVVTDRTTGKPSAGDTIAVINTAQGMDEIAKTTSDAKGRFSVNAPDGGQILLHITHGGAEYFKSVQPGAGSADIDVYDSAKKIDGISGEALVLRAETDAAGKTLNVAENFFVQNASAPQRTEYGGNTFDFYLPKGAEISLTLASAPGGLPTNSKVVTIDAASGHYAFTFPIRPGETRFQVAYSLPYSGKQPFALKLSVPTGDVAVMLPKSMQFQGSAAFQPLNDPSVVNSQSYDAHQPPFAQPVEFTLLGTGQLPAESGDTAQGGGDQSGNSGPADQTATGGQRPGGGLGAPEDPNAINDPWAKYKWWIVSVLGLALVAGAGIMLKNSPAAAVAGAAPTPSGDLAVPPSEFRSSVAPAPAAVAVAGASPLLQALKDELFELETDRLMGRLSEAQYAEHKAAFDVVLRRALSRG